MPLQDDAPRALGVYARSVESEIGTGATAGTRETVTWWYARLASPGRVELQPLTSAGLPSGIVSRMALAEFLKVHRPEPFYYRENPSQALDALCQALLDPRGGGLPALGARERKTLAAFVGAEPPAGEDPEYMAQARQTLETLRCTAPDALEEHRASLNHFAVSLRKEGHFNESIGFYEKAVELEGNDENVFFNLARVHYDKGDRDACREALERALSINPGFMEAIRFLRFLSGKKLA
ncbi:hypothetical protein NNJEOMEG_02894 [Fundidesulfovibrio magnetotacticus]|uniref:Tetratricopeptide repeat protein n=1 Tax=Fundidesulfovibrio magnetotacticus TaxID=2730080 RepID=A0A6V8LWS5_9BACT|nr:tetratricopeptide repeat protein [Fundidesulfovibrio magnetotacticus]GFK95041.1 hypothetical protein NNJEOMEG_02894 [Fundidesulfovibrio magnetotacticus]